MKRELATLTGFCAILSWALLAVLTDLSGEIPPFQLAAMTFGIGGLAGLVAMTVRRASLGVFRQPPRVWALGVGGLFGYHLLYFSALRAAPAAEASLIAFLWPLLIVLLSTFATGERLKAVHVTGALIGLVGAALLIVGPSGFALDPEHRAGYLLAFAAAFVWSGYSVLSRLVAEVPTDAVAGFCLTTSIGAVLIHVLIEDTFWPTEATAWVAVLGLGLGPVGLAFYLWDIGVKKGDLALLGAASYCAPLFSTIILIFAGRAEATWSLIGACALITAGASIAASDMLRQAFSRRG